MLLTRIGIRNAFYCSFSRHVGIGCDRRNIEKDIMSVPMLAIVLKAYSSAGVAISGAYMEDEYRFKFRRQSVTAISFRHRHLRQRRAATAAAC